MQLRDIGNFDYLHGVARGKAFKDSKLDPLTEGYVLGITGAINATVKVDSVVNALREVGLHGTAHRVECEARRLIDIPGIEYLHGVLKNRKGPMSAHSFSDYYTAEFLLGISNTPNEVTTAGQIRDLLERWGETSVVDRFSRQVYSGAVGGNTARGPLALRFCGIGYIGYLHGSISTRHSHEYIEDIDPQTAYYLTGFRNTPGDKATVCDVFTVLCAGQYPMHLIDKLMQQAMDVNNCHATTIVEKVDDTVTTCNTTVASGVSTVVSVGDGVEARGVETLYVETSRLKTQDVKTQDAKMVLVPVHPEDFEEVTRYIRWLEYERDFGALLRDVKAGIVSREEIGEELPGMTIPEKYHRAAAFLTPERQTDFCKSNCGIVYAMWIGLPKEYIPVPDRNHTAAVKATYESYPNVTSRKIADCITGVGDHQLVMMIARVYPDVLNVKSAEVEAMVKFAGR